MIVIKKISIIFCVFIVFIKSYGQEIYIDTLKEVYITNNVLSFIYEDFFNNDTNFYSYVFSKNKEDNIKTIHHIVKNSRIILNYENNKLKELYNMEKAFIVGQYISFHNNGAIDSIGNYEPYNDNFIERIKCDTIYTDFFGRISESFDCKKGFQDKDWFFFDEKGKLLMIKTYDKGILVRKIIVPAPR